MRESLYQTKLIRKIKRLFPGCHVLKNDSSYQQGIPDLVVLYGNRWAMLEVKSKPPSGPEDFEPNQEWFVEEFGRMSFGAVIYPENEEDVLYDLQRAFEICRSARGSKR